MAMVDRNEQRNEMNDRQLTRHARAAGDRGGMSAGVSVAEDATDITARLPTLQFESTIPEDQRTYLSLRSRSHAMTASVCAQAAYFACVLTEARLVETG
jgi:hypothetical protein